MTVTRRSILAAAPSVLALAALPAYAQKKYDAGAGDTDRSAGIHPASLNPSVR